MNADKFVTLASFDNSIDAHMLRSQLERENIPCFILDENIVTLNPLATLGMGGIKVKVMERDLAAAEEVIRKVQKKPIVNADNSVVVCPACQSKHISPGLKSASIFSVAFWGFLLGMYPMNVETKYYCHNCKATFKRDEAKSPHVS